MYIVYKKYCIYNIYKFILYTYMYLPYSHFNFSINFVCFSLKINNLEFNISIHIYFCCMHIFDCSNKNSIKVEG